MEHGLACTSGRLFDEVGESGYWALEKAGASRSAYRQGHRPGNHTTWKSDFPARFFGPDPGG
eukprot:1782027-Alexandrium_andersonii.AAC.1